MRLWNAHAHKLEYISSMASTGMMMRAGPGNPGHHQQPGCGVGSRDWQRQNSCLLGPDHLYSAGPKA